MRALQELRSSPKRDLVGVAQAWRGSASWPHRPESRSPPTAMGSHGGDVGPAPARGGTSEAEALLRLDEMEGDQPGGADGGGCAAPRPGKSRGSENGNCPTLDGPISVPDHGPWRVYALLLEATAHKALGDVSSAVYALERALDAAEPDHAVLSLIVHSESAPQPSSGSTHAAAGLPRHRSARPYRGYEGNSPTTRPQAVARCPQRSRDTNPAFPPDPFIGTRDSQRALCVGEHGQDPPPPRVRQAGSEQPKAGGRAGPCPGTARTLIGVACRDRQLPLA